MHRFSFLLIFILTISPILAFSSDDARKDSLILEAPQNFPDSSVYSASRNKVKRYWDEGNKEKTIKQLNEIIAYATSKGDTSKKAKLLKKKGIILDDFSFYDEAIEAAQESEKLFSTLKDTAGLAGAYNCYGLVHWHTGKIEESFKAFLTAEKYYEIGGDYKNKAMAISNIAILYYEQADYDKTLKYFLEYLDVVKMDNDKEEIARIQGNIGVVYKKLNQFDKAIEYYNKSKDYYKESNNIKSLISTYSNIASMYLNTEDFDLARENLNEAIKLISDDTSPRILNNLFSNFGNLESAIGNYSKAIHYYNITFDLESVKNSYQNLRSLHDNLADTYSKMGKHEKAYTHLSKSYAYSDSISQKSKTSELAKMEVKFETHSKELEIEKQRNDILQQDKKVFRMGLAIMLLSLLVLSSLLWLFVSKNKSAQKEKKLLEIQNQKIEQKNKELAIYNVELESFAAISSHDLKEPLRNIGSFSSLLERKYGDQLGTDAKDYFTFIKKGVKQMNALISDLVIYSEIRQKDNLNHIINTAQLVKSVVSNLQSNTKEKNIQIEIEDLSYITANSFKIQKVFENLISNAIKYAPDSNGKITIFSEKTELETIFGVRDNGIGIEAQYHDQIFSLFKRLHNRNTYEGSGVGLALCKKIIEEQYKGRIWLESTLGQGSTFYFSFPKKVNTSTPDKLLVAVNQN